MPVTRPQLELAARAICRMMCVASDYTAPDPRAERHHQACVDFAAALAAPPASAPEGATPAQDADIAALTKAVDRWSATHSFRSERTRGLMYRLLLAVKSRAAAPAPAAGEAERPVLTVEQLRDALAPHVQMLQDLNGKWHKAVTAENLVASLTPKGGA